MCGRYRLSRRKELLAEYFGADFADMDWQPRYNIAPIQAVPVIRHDGASRLKATLVRWGLVPSWANDPNIGARMINARSETAASKPSFRELLQKRRCLIPADGFYEWKRLGREKQPFCFEVQGGQLFAFAGLWDCWISADGKAIETCTILTTTANEVMADVHDRMPVILHSSDYAGWLDSEILNSGRAMALLRPHEAELMSKYPVSSRINYVTKEGPECSAHNALAPATSSLFS